MEMNINYKYNIKYYYMMKFDREDKVATGIAFSCFVLYGIIRLIN